jgi:hypothetical protein
VTLVHSILAWAETPVTYIFLLRFPILCLLLLVGFRWIALRIKPDLLANLYDVDGPGMVLVTLAALLCSWAVFLTGWIIYSHGPRRFVMGSWESLGPPPLWGYAMASILGLICVSGVFAYSPQQNPSRPVRNLWFGFGGGLALAAALLASLRGVRDVLVAIHPATAFVAWLTGLVGSHGYVDDQNQLFPEHLVALALFLLSLAVYGALGLFKRSRRGRPSGVPTLVYVLLMLMLAAWGLSALSFALDPYHVPVLLTLVVWLVVVSRSPRTDHYFNTYSIPYAPGQAASPKQANCAPNPAEVLAFPEDGRVVVVAASGGGIQAAAWTARVLTGLEAQNPGKFAPAVRLISSVSGGSVGAMYFSGRYQVDGQLGNPPEAVTDAKASSLEDVSWGLAYPDLLRVLLPAICWRFGGRGRALERAWLHSPELQRSLSARLSDWFQDVREGRRPANIFNATLTETGDRLLFSTSYLPVGNCPTPPARWDFHELYLNDQKTQTLDVAVVTAARMSATFPYVTPAARPDAGGPGTPQLHVVDGGYFDNYGMDTLLEWLDDGLTELQNDPARRDRFSKLQVMIVEIHEAPDPHRLVPPQVRQKRSWFFQSYAPLVTLFSVRTAGQRSHNQVDLALMKQKWGNTIQHVLFEFGTHDPNAPVAPDALKSALLKDSATAKNDQPTQLAGQAPIQDPTKLEQAVDPPLSWHLTEKQKENIESEWVIQASGSQAKAVAAFLSPSAPEFVTPR